MRTCFIYRALLFAAIFCLISVTPLSAAPEISVTYSHRQMAHGEVDPLIPEGCYIAVFTTEDLARPINPPDGLEQLSLTQWQYTFPWNWSPLEIQFFDASAETVTITAAPELYFPFDPTLHNMPVINVQTDSTNLWDPELGLNVFGNHNNCLQRGELWERPARWQFYDQSLTPVLDEAIGLRINGGSGRAYQQKGFRFYFDDYGTADEIAYDFFGTYPISFRRLVIRAGRVTSENLSSGIFDGLFADFGHLTSRWATVGLYLNKEYWGYYSMRERIDQEFIEHTYNLAADNYVLMKDGESVHGDTSPWWNFLDACAAGQQSATHSWYENAQRTVDLSSYIDWLLINIYGAATDNGSQYNVALVQIGNGPWSFIPWDEDGLLSWVNYYYNYFRFLSVGSLSEYWEFKPQYVWSGTPQGRIRWAAPFRALMQNSEFKARFAERYWELHNGLMSVEAMTERLAELANLQSPEMEKHFERWTNYDIEYYHHVVNMKQTWINQRWELLDAQFADFMELYRVPVELSKFNANLNASGNVELAWRTESQEQVAGFVLYSGNNPDQLQEIATWQSEPTLAGENGIWQQINYSYWDNNAAAEGDSLYYQLAWENIEGAITPLNWLITVPLLDPAQLFINEFLASNVNNITDETGQHEDWVELYNAGPGPADLGGMFLTDDLALTTKWQLPNYRLEPGEHLLIWTDSDPEDGPWHTTFKLNASGEEIGLYTSFAQGNMLIDSVVFGPQVTDVSLGRQMDGGDTWISFPTPTPGTANDAVSAASDIPTGLILEPAFPNPFNPRTEIRCHLPEAVSVELGIYDVMGKRVCVLADGTILSPGTHTFSWDGTNNRGNGVAAGVYLVRLVTPGGTKTGKLVLVQ